MPKKAAGPALGPNQGRPIWVLAQQTACAKCGLAPLPFRKECRSRSAEYVDPADVLRHLRGIRKNFIVIDTT